MKRFFGLLSFAVIISTVSLAQNELDALRYSYLIPGGTARSVGMGGAFGGLGADASVLSSNPAGMGVYQRSDFTISPAFSLTNNSAAFTGQERTDFNFNFNINNIAYIGTIQTGNSDNYSSVTLGFAYNRLNCFNENIQIQGRNDFNSLTDWFAARALGTPASDLYDDDNFYSSLAWETYLIDQHPDGGNQYVSALDNYGQIQREQISRSGYMGEYAFSIAGNFNHQLYIGATLGIQSIRFEQVSIIDEIDDQDVINGFDSFRYREYLETRGSGLNFKLGLLYRPVSWLRVGGAVHTPTFLGLNDVYYGRLSSEFSIAPNVWDSIPQYKYSWDSKQGRFSYDLNTPFRAIGNLAFIINPQILLSIDYEFTDYTQARLRSNDYAFFDENDNIRDYFKEGHNVKAGVEYRMGPVSFRLGAAYYDSPFKSTNINKDYYTMVYSGGIGIRGQHSYFDIGYSYLANEKYHFLYQGYDVDSPVALIKQNQSRLVMTMGFVF